MVWPWRKAPLELDLTSFLNDEDRIQTAAEAKRLVYPPDDFLDALVHEVSRAMKMPIVAVTFVYGREADSLASVGFDYSTHSQAARDSICTFVAAAGRGMIFDSPETAPLLQDCMNAKGLTYYAGSPIRFDGKVVGVLGVADETGAKHNNRKVMKDVRWYRARIEQQLYERNHVASSGF